MVEGLPPGFRFHPTDEELVLHYLFKKVESHSFSVSVITDVDLYKFDPWDLPVRAMFGEKEWYFFSPRDRKYPNGSRPNRSAGSGYWKATGTDKSICTNMGNVRRKIGIKKSLVFYRGKAPSGIKTNWIMHEYRLAESHGSRLKGSQRQLDDCVLCRIYKKKPNSGLRQEREESGRTADNSVISNDDNYLTGFQENSPMSSYQYQTNTYAAQPCFHAISNIDHDQNSIAAWANDFLQTW